MFDKNSFCTLPWSQIQINTGGDFKVCCFSGFQGSRSMAEEDDGNMMNILTHDINDALNSKVHKSIRLAQSKNERHNECEVCWMREDASGHSHRTNRTKDFRAIDNSVKIEDAPNVMSSDGSIKNPMVIDLDMRFGNLCNAKCLHCEPLYSNLWYHDYIALNETTSFTAGSKKYNIRSENGVLKSDVVDNKWWETDIWWNQFDKIKHNLRRIYVTGGEPFLVPAHEEMLERLIKDDLAKNIIMSYDTNLSVINKRILSKLDKFKSTQLSVSLDDIEDRYELFRFPLKFDRLVENLNLIKKHNINVDCISCCIGIPTATSVLRLVPFFGDLGYNKFRLRLLRFPEVFDLKHLPKEEKQKLITLYKNSNVGEVNSKIVTGYLENTMDVYNPSSLSGFVKRMDTLDKMRKTDWRNVMPDVYKMVKGYE